MSPLLLRDENNEIYFLHPVFLSFLSHIEKLDLLYSSEKILLDLIKILGYDRSRARLSNEADNLEKAGIPKKDLIGSLRFIKNDINYSHILRR